jgi:hypothetical protein
VEDCQCGQSVKSSREESVELVGHFLVVEGLSVEGDRNFEVKLGFSV